MTLTDEDIIRFGIALEEKFSAHEERLLDRVREHIDDLNGSSAEIAEALRLVKTTLDARETLATARFEATTQGQQNLATEIAKIADAVVRPAMPHLSAIEVQQARAVAKQRNQVRRQIHELRQTLADAEAELVRLLNANPDENQRDSNTRLRIARAEAERATAEARIAALEDY